jgi:lipoprotein-anchoring transpeptidase ErfK/SrfK
MHKPQAATLGVSSPSLMLLATIIASQAPLGSLPAAAQVVLAPVYRASELGARPRPPHGLIERHRRRLAPPEARGAAPMGLGSRPQSNAPAHSTRATLPRTAPHAGPPAPLLAIVSLSDQQIRVFTATGIAAQSRVSTGKPGHATPTGVFSVLQRRRYHESNIYSGAPMPYMQRLTWSGIALHQGVVPGYPASHGCIRLPTGFATELWEAGRIGMRVIVAPSETHAVPIESPRLPQPVMTRIAASDLPTPVQWAGVGSVSEAAATQVLDPFQLAQVRKVRAQAEKLAAEARIAPAVEAAAAASAAASRAAQDLARLERALATAEADLAAKQEAIVRNQSADAGSDLGRELAAAELRAEAARTALAEARERERAQSDAAFAAARSVREAEVAHEAAAAAHRLAGIGTEPVTIFVSRKEGRVMVRQGFHLIHEEPVPFRDPERPLGTHVFTAMASSAAGDRLAWHVVTVPERSPETSRDKRRSGREETAAGVEVQRPHRPSTAAEVLDRFDLPPDTVALIADRLWPGATLIVSDHGPSRETGRGTDFIVLTR